MHPPVGLEWLIILVVIVLLFGAKKIPDLAKGLGEGLREFKKAQKEIEKEPPQVSDKSKVNEKASEPAKTEEKK